MLRKYPLLVQSSHVQGAVIEVFCEKFRPQFNKRVTARRIADIHHTWQTEPYGFGLFKV